MNVCSIWAFAQILDDFYYLDIWQCDRYFVAALFKELAFIQSRHHGGALVGFSPLTKLQAPLN